MIKILKSSFISQVELYIRNLIRLMDQEERWFYERVLALNKGGYERVEYIEKIYLEPLNRKIKELAERISRL